MMMSVMSRSVDSAAHQHHISVVGQKQKVVLVLT